MTMTDDDLERALGALGEALDRQLPAARLEREVVAGVAVSPRRWLVAAAVVAAVTVTAAVVIPGSRRAIARWLGIAGVRIERVDSLPTLPPDPVPADPAWGLGPAVDARTASERTGLGVPRLPGRDAGTVHVVPIDGAPMVVVAYARPVALLSVTRADLVPWAFAKIVDHDTDVQQFTIRTAAGASVPAVWISGSPHVITIEVTRANGNVDQVTDVIRLAGNTLLWQDGDLLYRLEADVDRATAVGLAATVVTGP